MATVQLLEKPAAQTRDATLDHYAVDPQRGLAQAEVEARLSQYGPNRLRQGQRRSIWSILVEQFKSVVVLLLVVAGALAFAFGEGIEGIAIVAVIGINAAIGFVIEFRAVRSMEALQELGQVMARVRRDGRQREVNAEQLVPGYVLVLQGGDVVTADVRLLEAAKLQANESALTGESMPVDKQTEPVDPKTELAERRSMVYKGTAITRGSGEGIVVATGMETELGHISSLVEEAQDETTPLEQRLDQLGQKLVWLTLGIAMLVVIGGVIGGKALVLMIETAIALAVASIPEGLPIVATIALARGMHRIARRNALLNRLATVETLGATNILCTDKTGTLTENKMTVRTLYLNSGKMDVDDSLPEVRALRIGVLCNNATLNPADDEGAVGEPLEVALLQAGDDQGLDRDTLLDDLPEAREIAFDTDTKMMATFHTKDKERNGAYYVAVKGAPEAVLDASQRHYTDPDTTTMLDDQARETWLERNEQLAAQGLRLLAVAEKTVQSLDVAPYEELTFVGLIGLLDPPRQAVSEAIKEFQRAGIRVIMVTGDQPVTARNIAAVVGLVENDQADVVRGKELRPPDQLSSEALERLRATVIFARVNPAQKLDIIALHQANGSRVAMTGDGVNDAPALKKADIGIAMGRRGTQVAKEAADMVLEDDALSTIVVAVRQGRVIFGNIRNFVLYLLSCNLSEIFVVGLASLVNAPLPITPLQILYLNLVTDVFPALALGMGEGDETVMDHPPRASQEAIMRRDHWGYIGAYSALITGSVLGVYAIALRALALDTPRAVTIGFLTLALAQLWHVFNMRADDASAWNNDITRNPWIWGALLLCVGLLLAAVYLPFMQTVLKTVPLSPAEWGLVLAASLVPLLVGQLGKSAVLLAKAKG